MLITEVESSSHTHTTVSLELSSHPCGLSCEPPYFKLWCASGLQSCDLLSLFEASSFGGSALWRAKVREECKEEMYVILLRFGWKYYICFRLYTLFVIKCFSCVNNKVLSKLIDFDYQYCARFSCS